MAPRAGAQTLCCHAPAASDMDTSPESPPGAAEAVAVGAAGEPERISGSAGGGAGSERSLEPAPTSGDVDLVGDNRAHVDNLHKTSTFGSLDSTSTVAGNVKGAARTQRLCRFSQKSLPWCAIPVDSVNVPCGTDLHIPASMLFFLWRRSIFHLLVCIRFALVRNQDQNSRFLVILSQLLFLACALSTAWCIFLGSLDFSVYHAVLIVISSSNLS